MEFDLVLIAVGYQWKGMRVRELLKVLGVEGVKVWSRCRLGLKGELEKDRMIRGGL